MKNEGKTKRYNGPKDEIAAINKANRDDDIRMHGKPTTFKSHMEKSKKAYDRNKYKKETNKLTLSESDMTELVYESVLNVLNEIRNRKQ